MNSEGKLVEAAAASAEFSADVRSSLTGQFLMAATLQARRAADVESRDAAKITDDDKVEHRGLVIGAIMQATAALESEIWEVMVYGPGHHLGSNGIDIVAKNMLAPLAEVLDGQSVVCGLMIDRSPS